MGANASCCQKEEDVPAAVVDIEAEVTSCGDDDSAIPTHDCGSPESLKTSSTPRLSFSRVLTVRRSSLMRGISLKETLRGGGWLWRASPIDLPMEQKASLWSRSRKVEYFDIFLSHTWATRGFWKYLSLSFQFGWAHVLLVWLVVAAVVAPLSWLQVLPATSSVKMDFQGFEADCPFGGWTLYLAVPASLLAFLLAPYSPDLRGKKQSSFLDVVSINQSDEEMMQQGIYGLGGFLSSSRELRILYSEPYLSRLWCLFEIAAFRTSNPSGRIRFAPLFVERGVATFWLGSFLAIHSFRLLVSLGGSPGPIGIVPACLPLLLAFHNLRKSLQTKRRMLSELENFDITAAFCRKDFDRDFVHGAICQWYGSLDAFTAYIRGPIRGELLANQARSQLPWYYALLIMSPTVSLGIDGLMCLGAAGFPLHCLVSYGLGVTVGIFTCWGMTMIQFAMFICNCCPLAKRPAVAAMQSIMLFALYMLVVLSGLVIGDRAYKHSVAAAGSWCAVTITLAWLSSGGLRLCVLRCCRNL